MHISIFMKLCVKYHKSVNVYVHILGKYDFIKKKMQQLSEYLLTIKHSQVTHEWKKEKPPFKSSIEAHLLIKLHYKRQLILRTLLNQTWGKLSVKQDFGEIHNPLSFINGDAFIKPY